MSLRRRKEEGQGVSIFSATSQQVKSELCCALNMFFHLKNVESVTQLVAKIRMKCRKEKVTEEHIFSEFAAIEKSTRLCGEQHIILLKNSEVDFCQTLTVTQLYMHLLLQA